VAIAVAARRGRRVLARGSGRLAKAGRASVPLKLTAAGRKALKRSPRVRAVLDVAANDAAGNRTSASRRVVLRR